MSAIEDHARSLFLGALERAPELWPAFLSESCGANTELRARVDQLLQAHIALGSIHGGVDAPVATVEEPVREGPGTVIAAYKLMEQIGEGGMGLVFVAEQQHPVSRKVALKVVKPGMDTRQVIARFEAERQALALMDHPNIAKVLDGGETASGRPFFVMELVKGVPITEFCDQNQVPIRARLELFFSVCQAVQHAHQKGIIHRDLKPSNVLVMSQDGVPVVKVIDFGVAKAIGQQLTDKTIYTQFSQLVGTPLYMSPEQAGQSGLDVDTRSDIYSLGVLLYELLTGTTPFDEQRLHQVGFDEMRRIIREEEPPRPSTRVSTLGQAATTASTNRKSDPKQLSRLFRGELDWIVMKALEKDRNRRYESASAFAADVQRYLHDEPVQACPPSAWYRFRKFARRNRMAVAIAGLVLFFIVSLGAGVGWVLRDRAGRQAETERGVTAALAEAADYLAEGDKQIDDPRRWQATIRLAQSAVERAEKLLAAGEATAELTARVQQLREEVEAAATDCRLRAELDALRVEGEVLAGREDRNREIVARCAEMLQRCGGELANPEQTGRHLRASRLREALLALLDEWWGRTDDAAEQQQLEKILMAAEPAPDAFQARWRAARRQRDGAALAKLAEDPTVQNLPALMVSNLARDLLIVKQQAAEERLLRAAVERYPDSFWLNLQLGTCLIEQGAVRAEEALRYLTAARALRTDVAVVYVNLGVALRAKGDSNEAIRLLRTALRLEPNFAIAHNDLGVCLDDNGDVDGAIRSFEAALTINPNFVVAHINLGDTLKSKGDVDGAIHHYQAALEVQPDSAEILNTLGEAWQDKHDVDRAVDCFRRALLRNPNFAAAHFNLGMALGDQKEVDKAIRCYQNLLAIRPKDAKAHHDLGYVLFEKKDLDGAIREYRAALAINPNYPGAHSHLGVALFHQKDLEGAIREYRAALAIKPSLARVHCNLGLALYEMKDLDGAIREYRAALAINDKFSEAHLNLGVALFDTKDVAGAIREYRLALAIDDKSAPAHNSLGFALLSQGDVKGAIRHCRRALEINPNNKLACVNLGLALEAQGDLEGAIDSYQHALQIDSTFSRAHGALGVALQKQGRFADARAAAAEGLKHLSSSDPHHAVLMHDLRRCEEMIALDRKLSAVVRGEAKPQDAAEMVALASLAQQPYKQLHATAVRLYRDAFVDPKLADPRTGNRYNAACSAALAGCGVGKDTEKPDDAERARLRGQALDWLRAELAAWGKVLEEDDAEGRQLARRELANWLKDADLAGVRGKALAKLPESERQPWRDLWADVEKTLAKAREKVGGEGKGEKKD
jgi:tetratricopeptide (TPR) repeat protein